jgi:hypothetical protein
MLQGPLHTYAWFSFLLCSSDWSIWNSVIFLMILNLMINEDDRSMSQARMTPRLEWLPSHSNLRLKWEEMTPPDYSFPVHFSSSCVISLQLLYQACTDQHFLHVRWLIGWLPIVNCILAIHPIHHPWISLYLYNRYARNNRLASRIFRDLGNEASKLLQKWFLSSKKNSGGT